MNFVQQIHFFGPINVSTAEMFRNMLLNAMNTQGLKGIEILMSSEGGDLNSGFTMYNYLRSFPLPTTVINMGAIESIALIPFLGAGIRRAVPNSRFLIHNFTWTFHNAPTNINRVEECSRSLSEDVERYLSIYHERTAGAQQPIDARLHLTGPATVILNQAAFGAGILTTEDSSYPLLRQPAIYDRAFK